MLALFVAGGCGSRGGTTTGTVEVGRHHLRFQVPRGWEHLDRGRQQLFCSGET